MQQRLIEKFSESIKVLNDYRNLYHAESSSTEQYKVANAINDILPKFCELIENDAEPVVRCDNCKCSIVNGGDCDSVLVNIRRNYITETNEFVHLYLEYCSNGVKMDEE